MVEDEDESLARGDAVAKIVDDCTDAWPEHSEHEKPEWKPRKESYLANLASKPAQSLLVALADKTHNAEAVLCDYRAHGDALWERFISGKADQCWYYQALADVFSKRLPGALAKQLSKAVKGFAK